MKGLRIDPLSIILQFIKFSIMEQFEESNEINTVCLLFQKLYLRFALVFFGLHIFPFPLTEIPNWGESVYRWVEKGYIMFANWGGKLFFNTPEFATLTNGSGDTTASWVLEFLMLLLSALICLIWQLADRRKRDDTALNYWTQVWVRYYLCFVMFSYGFGKVFPLQFGTMTSYRLHQSLGDMSPMGLLWTFMAYSPEYQMFSGLAEVLCGILLFFRRTQLLGALIACGVMLNIFALNMCYDVPVKIYSFLLMLMAIYIASDDAKRLINFFIQNKTAESHKLFMPFLGQKWYKIGRIALKTALFGLLIYTYIYKNLEDNAKSDEPLTAFYGPYTVSKFIKNGIESPESDTLRWEKMFIDRRGAYNMIYVSNEMNLGQRIFFEKNDTAHTVTFEPLPDTTKYVLNYYQVDSNQLIIKGKLQKDSLQIELKKMKKKEFLLTKRGFRWINEMPFNR